MKLRPYIASSDERFVFSSFCLQTGALGQELDDLLSGRWQPEKARFMVAVAPHEKRADGSDLLYGWAGAIRGELVYAYVKHDLRNFPVIPLLVDALAIERPVVIHFDSVAIRTMMGAFGWSYRIKENEREPKSNDTCDPLLHR